MKRPFFSIIIPTLNEEKFIPKLLDSIAAQTVKDFEVIVVDGPSKDKTKEVVLAYKKRLPLTLVSSAKGSLPLQRNLGAASAKGEWFVFIDADSVLHPYFIERIIFYIREKHPVFFTTWALPDSELTHDSIFTLLTNIYWESTVLINRPAAPGPLTVVDAQAFRSVGGYDEEHDYNEDVDLGLRLQAHGYQFSVFRESLYVWSMRRIRREGKMKVMNQYILSMLPVLIFKKPLKHMPGYTMGGHLYSSKKRIQRSVLKSYERKLKELMKDIFD